MPLTIGIGNAHDPVAAWFLSTFAEVTGRRR